jgi:hypothetical protein
VKGLRHPKNPELNSSVAAIEKWMHLRLPIEGTGDLGRTVLRPAIFGAIGLGVTAEVVGATKIDG